MVTACNTMMHRSEHRAVELVKPANTCPRLSEVRRGVTFLIHSPGAGKRNMPYQGEQNLKAAEKTSRPSDVAPGANYMRGEICKPTTQSEA